MKNDTQEQPWILTSERLPEDGQQVEIKGPSQIAMLGSLYQEGWSVGWQVTHWRPKSQQVEKAGATKEHPWILASESIPTPMIEVEAITNCPNSFRMRIRKGEQWQIENNGKWKDCLFRVQRWREIEPTAPTAEMKMSPGEAACRARFEQVRSRGAFPPYEQKRREEKDRWDAVAQAAFTAFTAFTDGPSDEEIDNAYDLDFGDTEATSRQRLRLLFAPHIAKAQAEAQRWKQASMLIEKTANENLAHCDKLKAELVELNKDLQTTIRWKHWAETDRDRLKGELAKYKQNWEGLRDAVYGVENHPSINFSNVEAEANEVRYFRDRALAELAALKASVGDLLAVIHRDGGHHQAENGLIGSLHDAHGIILGLFETSGELDVLKAAPESWPTGESAFRVWSVARSDHWTKVANLFTARHNAIVTPLTEERDRLASLLRHEKLLAANKLSRGLLKPVDSIPPP